MASVRTDLTLAPAVLAAFDQPNRPSLSQIAARFGVTKNTVAGIVYRAKEIDPGCFTSQAAWALTAKLPFLPDLPVRVCVPAAAEPQPAAPAAPREFHVKQTRYSYRETECQWPTERPGKRPRWHFCGAPVRGDGVYCPKHTNTARADTRRHAPDDALTWATNQT